MVVQTAPRTIPTVSLRDSLAYNLLHVLPYFTQGIFTRSRFWVTLWSRLHRDPMSVRFITALRRKYGSEYFYVYMLASKSLVVLDLDGIKHVLDNSPFIYGDAKAKRSGMSHFQPGAVTISRGEAWQDRRRFNEHVLASGDALHRHAGRFLTVARQEVAAAHAVKGSKLTWDDFDGLFERLTRQCIFGARARTDTTPFQRLKKMMRESNRTVFLRKSRDFEPFYEQIRGYLGNPEDESLAADSARAPSTGETRVENQIPHWMFAMNETLATNTARALAVIVAHPQAEARVRQEMERADLSTVGGIHGLRYLEACIQEAMRLWPTTPLLARETVTADRLGGADIPPQTQVLILNNFNHRDRETFPSADTFSPELWLDGRASADYRFNHLSNGTQVCAGVNVLLFMAKAVLATLLSADRYALVRPRLNPAAPLPHAFNYFDLVFAT